MRDSYIEPPRKLDPEKDYRIGNMSAFMILFASFSGDIIKSAMVFAFGLLIPILGSVISPLIFTPLFFVFFFPWFKSHDVGLFDKWPKLLFWALSFTPLPFAQFTGNLITVLMSRHHDRKAHEKAKIAYEETGVYNPKKFL